MKQEYKIDTSTENYRKIQYCVQMIKQIALDENISFTEAARAFQILTMSDGFLSNIPHNNG